MLEHVGYLATVQAGSALNESAPGTSSKGYQKASERHAQSAQITGFRAGQYFARSLTINGLTYLSPMPVPQRLKCEHLAGQEWAIRKATIAEHICGHPFHTLHHATVIFSFAESESLQEPFQRSVLELYGALSGGLHIPAATDQFDCAKLTDSIPK